MTDATARFALPFIVPGQAQKELMHNEALTLIDMAISPAVESAPSQTPPEEPVEGQSWIVGEQAAGAWSGKAHQIAVWTAGGWRFLRPSPGVTAWNKQAGLWAHFDGLGWDVSGWPVAAIRVRGEKVVGERQPAVPSPSGGTTIDQEARATINALIATLKSHGLTG